MTCLRERAIENVVGSQELLCQQLPLRLVGLQRDEPPQQRRPTRRRQLLADLPPFLRVGVTEPLDPGNIPRRRVRKDSPLQLVEDLPGAIHDLKIVAVEGLLEGGLGRPARLPQDLRSPLPDGVFPIAQLPDRAVDVGRRRGPIGGVAPGTQGWNASPRRDRQSHGKAKKPFPTTNAALSGHALAPFGWHFA